MNLGHAESRPGADRDGSGTCNALKDCAPTESTGSAPDARPEAGLSPADIASSIPTFALIVRTGTGRISRRLYLSMPAAIKATERAQARGHAASLEIVRVVPSTGHSGEGSVSDDA